jgi:hypothetical protein
MKRLTFGRLVTTLYVFFRHAFDRETLLFDLGGRSTLGSSGQAIWHCNLLTPRSLLALLKLYYEL